MEMENKTVSEKEVGIVVRTLLFVFGVVTASAAFVIACMLVRDHAEYTFLQVWLAIVVIVLIFAIGLLWMITSLKVSARKGVGDQSA